MSPLDALTQYGLPGIVLAVALLALRAVYLERNDEARARVEDAKAYAATLLVIQKEILTAVDKLTDLYNEKRRGP